MAFSVGVALQLLLLFFICPDVALADDESMTQSSQLEVITTSACNNIRFDSFQARLDMFYFYFVEYKKTGVELDLVGIENALAISIASALDDCDDRSRPVYALEISSRHVFSEGEGMCAPGNEGNECRVIRGVTSILLDRGAAEAKAVAYAVVRSVLRDTDFLRDFTASSLARAEFIRPIGENLVILGNTETQEVTTSPSSDSSATAKIAITAAFTSFFLTAVIFYGVFRNQQKAELERGRTPVKARLAHYQAKRRQYFQQLQDDQRLGSGWMTTNPLQMPAPSVTWSISDLTSDSQSIKSSLRMDRIDEEGPSDEYDAECVSDDSEPRPEKAAGGHVSFDFVARWNEPKSISEYTSPGDSTSQAFTDEECPSSAWEVPEGPPSSWEETRDECIDVEAQTPRRRNRIEDFDATTEPHSLLGCRFLEDSMDEIEETGRDLDASNITDPTEDDSELLYSEPNTPIHRNGAKDTEDLSEFHTPAAHYLDETLDAIDMALENWFQHLLIQLARARTQKRITI